MIFRPISLLTFAGAMLAGLHLYQTKHEVALLDRELRAIGKQIDEAKDRTQALQAEWAWLNEPERLRGVAQRHLQLEPMMPAQFLRLNEAERRLPAVAAYEGPTALFAERAPAAPAGPVQLALLPRLPAPVQLAHVQPTAAVIAPAPAPLALALPVAPPKDEAEPVVARPAAPVPAPITLPKAEVQPLPLVARPAAPPKLEAQPVIARPAAAAAAPPLPRIAEPARQHEPAPRPAEPRHAPVEVARLARPTALPVAAARPTLRPAPEVASLPPVTAPVRPALAQVTAPPPVPTMRPALAQVAAAAPPRPMEAPAVALGSALGGRSLLPPPVPFGSANAATLNGTVAR